MQLASHERARFQVDGVAAPITADITRRRDDGLVVTQALPFLRLDTPVTDEDGRPRRISRVAIAMDGDVPRLLLELLDEEEAHADDEELACADDVVLVEPEPAAVMQSDDDEALEAETADPEDTLESFTPGVSTRPARTDSTVPYEFQTRESAEPVVLADDLTLPAETLALIQPPKPSLFARLRNWLFTLFGRPALS